MPPSRSRRHWRVYRLRSRRRGTTPVQALDRKLMNLSGRARVLPRCQPRPPSYKVIPISYALPPVSHLSNADAQFAFGERCDRLTGCAYRFVTRYYSLLPGTWSRRGPGACYNPAYTVEAQVIATLRQMRMAERAGKG